MDIEHKGDEGEDRITSGTMDIEHEGDEEEGRIISGTMDIEHNWHQPFRVQK